MKDPLFSGGLNSSGVAKKKPAPPRRVPAKDFVKGSMFRELTVSALAHVCVALGFLIASKVSERLSLFSSPPLKESVQKSAIRVDLVDLPRLKLSEMENIDLTKPVAEEPISAPQKSVVKEVDTPPQPSPTAMKDRTKSADPKRAVESKATSSRVAELQSRLRADSRRRELVERLKRESGAGEGLETRPALAGNILSQGYSLSGDVAKDSEVFYGKATAHLRARWELPGWILSSQLRAVMRVKLSPNGRVLSKEFVLRSGQDEFDVHVERAIDLADPFPPPPEALVREVMERGIEFGFPK